MCVTSVGIVTQACRVFPSQEFVSRSPQREALCVTFVTKMLGVFSCPSQEFVSRSPQREALCVTFVAKMLAVVSLSQEFVSQSPQREALCVTFATKMLAVLSHHRSLCLGPLREKSCV